MMVSTTTSTVKILMVSTSMSTSTVKILMVSTSMSTSTVKNSHFVGECRCVCTTVLGQGLPFLRIRHIDMDDLPLAGRDICVS